jgi:hypothetical protein
MKPKQHPKTHLTKNERTDLIRHLLRPCEHRGNLHSPKEAYTNEENGFNMLANDIAHWLGHKSLAVHVSTDQSVDEGWHAALTHEGGTVEIDKHIASNQPFIAAYFSVLGVLQIIVWRYSHLHLHHSDNQKLLEHMSVASGLGTYGVNAVHQPKVHYFDSGHHIWHDRIFSVPTSSYLSWFKAYSNEHNIPLNRYEDDLLPAARKSLELPPLSRPSKNPLIAHAEAATNHRRSILILSIVAAVSIIAVGFFAWQRIPRPLSAEQRAQLTQISELHKAYDTCQNELVELIDTVENPDIPNRRSIQTKAKTCEQLRQEHNRLVREIKTDN